MENDPDLLTDGDDELLLRLEASSRQTAELSRKLAETAMARITGQRRIDLRAVKSMDMLSGSYQITVSEPEAPQPLVTLTWMPGKLILGVDLIETNRDVHLPPAKRPTTEIVEHPAAPARTDSAATPARRNRTK